MRLPRAEPDAEGHVQAAEAERLEAEEVASDQRRGLCPAELAPVQLATAGERHAWTSYRAGAGTSSGPRFLDLVHCEKPLRLPWVERSVNRVFKSAFFPLI